MQAGSAIDNLSALVLCGAHQGCLEPIQKKIRCRADVAYHYGFNAFQLTERELYYYASELPRLTAERELAERQVQATPTPEAVYKLAFAVTGNADEADKARAAIMAQEVRQATNAPSE